MELLQFEVTNAGTLGSRWTPPAPETKKSASLPGAALAALLQEEDDEDDWGGDAPDMSAEFARLSHLNEESAGWLSSAGALAPAGTACCGTRRCRRPHCHRHCRCRLCCQPSG